MNMEVPSNELDKKRIGIIIANPDGNILLSGHIGDDPEYSIPVGLQDDNETPLDAGFRIAQEQFGITLTGPDVMAVWSPNEDRVSDDTLGHLSSLVVANTFYEDLETTEPGKQSEVKWSHPSLLPPRLTDVSRSAIECYLTGGAHQEADSTHTDDLQ